jgi:hypothetical protein
MSALRLGQADEEIVGVRVDRRQRRKRSGRLLRKPKVVRGLLRRRAAPALETGISFVIGHLALIGLCPIGRSTKSRY